MKTLLFVLKGFETMEFSVFVDVMGWAAPLAFQFWLIKQLMKFTSSCPETASGVAFKLLERLTSTEKMEIVKHAMGF